MNVETKKWKLTGKIQRYNEDNCFNINDYTYWVDGEVDNNFQNILKKIGKGKQVTIIIKTCEVK